MCNFFSCITKGDGKLLYFDAAMRRKIIGRLSKYTETDSHSSIAHYHGIPAAEEHLCGFYEYNPLTDFFVVDRAGRVDDSEQALAALRRLDWKTIVPELIIKPIVCPFRLPAPVIGEKELDLLRAWASVGASVGAPVGASVGAPVRASVGASVWDSVWDSVRDSVGASVRASVGDSVRASVGDSVRSSVWDSVRSSVWAYIGSFFHLPQWTGRYPYQAACDLWERGVVPSFDSKAWRLHAGPDGQVVYILQEAL